MRSLRRLCGLASGQLLCLGYCVNSAAARLHTSARIIKGVRNVISTNAVIPSNRLSNATHLYPAELLKRGVSVLGFTTMVVNIVTGLFALLSSSFKRREAGCFPWTCLEMVLDGFQCYQPCERDHNSTNKKTICACFYKCYWLSNHCWLMICLLQSHAY